MRFRDIVKFFLGILGSIIFQLPLVFLDECSDFLSAGHHIFLVTLQNED